MGLRSALPLRLKLRQNSVKQNKEKVMANNSVGGDSKVTPLGSGQKSGNDYMGIDGRIAGGTTGSRPDSSSRYGGDGSKGSMFVGDSVAKDDKQLNSGGGSRPSAASGQYGPGSPGWAAGGVGSRENMPKYGGETNQGRLVGQGAEKPSTGQDQLKRDLPAQAGMDVVKGTSAGEANLATAKKGIGKAGKSGARM
jgi:hypothetical protein